MSVHFASKKIEAAIQSLKKMMEHHTVVIHRLGNNESEQRRYYRILQNERVEIDNIKESIYADCIRQVESGHHYLLLEDTTQLNFDRNRENIHNQEYVGLIGNNRSLGCYLHPTMVVDSMSGRCIGYSHIEEWSHKEGRKTKTERNYNRQPIEAKESYRWIRSAEESRRRLGGDVRLTVICDRESDVFQFYARREDYNILIRCRSDRNILGTGEKLYKSLSSESVSGRYTIDIRGDVRKQSISRRAEIEIRYKPVELAPPSNIVVSDERDKAPVVLWAIEAREVTEGRKNPILWRLLTTHRVESVEQALQCIGWYQERWHIEQSFRLLKRDGFNIEGSDLETSKGLLIMTMLSMQVISKILTLHISSKNAVPEPIGDIIDEDEHECLKILNKKYQGRTVRQKNPYPTDSLQWLYWIIARMGGWKPHEKQAGVITLFRGWTRFQKCV